jgi:orotate phosphoribosyltransferase
MHDITEYLFKTNAIKVADSKFPFWYTSGLIGPFYINTHYLAGGEATALELLELITSNPDSISAHSRYISAIHAKVKEIYETHPIFRDTVRKTVDLIKTHMDVSRIDFVSGGERRDWFFHSIVAEILDKPALFIHKDSSVWVKENDDIAQVQWIEGANALHVADLVTIASSYVKVWIPAIKQLGGTITHALNIVDRLQGADKVLKGYGIATLSVAQIDAELFHTASQRGYITRAQHGMIVDYIRDPFTTMKKFLLENPDFLKDSLASDDDKIKARARLCVGEDLYKLKII